MQLRPITDDERTAFTGAVLRQFGETLPESRVQQYSRLLETGRAIAVFDDDRIVATATAESYELCVPGGVAACAGITAVGVRTDFRRRGLLNRMMGHCLEQAHERGEPLAALYSSEEAIYRRYGFGPAAPTVNLRVRRSEEPLLAVPAHDEVRLVDAEEARPRMRRVFDQVWRRHPGMLGRTDARWEILHGPDEADAAGPDGMSPPYYAVVGDRGYAVYRLVGDDADDGPGGTVKVVELVAADPEARAALWQFLASVDLFPNVEASLRPPDDPLPHMVRDPDRVRSRAHGPMWVRLVDVPAALRARRYERPGTLVVEVADDLRPGNSGRWAFEGDEQGAACEPTDQSPDLSMDAAALATAYLGGVGWGTLVRARRVAEHTPGAARLADAMFASDPLPWNVRDF